MKNCVTHHACDCIQAKVKRLESDLAAAKAERDEAKNDLAESRKASKLWEAETYQRIAERDEAIELLHKWEIASYEGDDNYAYVDAAAFLARMEVKP
jgi:hypothetical protein